jgi:hypothetical protein
MGGWWSRRMVSAGPRVPRLFSASLKCSVPRKWPRSRDIHPRRHPPCAGFGFSRFSRKTPRRPRQGPALSPALICTVMQGAEGSSLPSTTPPAQALSRRTSSSPSPPIPPAGCRPPPAHHRRVPDLTHLRTGAKTDGVAAEPPGARSTSFAISTQAEGGSRRPAAMGKTVCNLRRCAHPGTVAASGIDARRATAFAGGLLWKKKTMRRGWKTL